MTDKNKKVAKRIKFFCPEEGITGWAPASKFRITASEPNLKPHGSHNDGILGVSGNEVLLECPANSGQISWVNMQPPATPESLNEDLGKESLKTQIPSELPTKLPSLLPNQRMDVNADSTVNKPSYKCPVCGKSTYFKSAEDYRPFCSRECSNKGTSIKEAASCDQCDAAMINGVFCHETGCPNKSRADREVEIGYNYPDVLDSQEDFEGDIEASLNKQAFVVHRKDGWHVLSEKGKNLGGPYKNKSQAVQRLREVEYFKSHKGSQKPFSKKEANVMDTKCEECGEPLGPEAFLSKWPVCGKCTRKRHKKVTGAFHPALGGTFQKHEDHEDVKMGIDTSTDSIMWECPKDSNKMRWDIKKKAEVLTDPYQALNTQVQSLRDRMSQVQERLQSNPLPKQAGEDSSTLDLPELFEDLTMGIDLLETKLGGDDIEPELHSNVESLENLLWTIEEQVGITPKLSEEEKAEPEHKEIVEDIEKAEGNEAHKPDEMEVELESSKEPKHTHTDLFDNVYDCPACNKENLKKLHKKKESSKKDKYKCKDCKDSGRIVDKLLLKPEGDTDISCDRCKEKNKKQADVPVANPALGVPSPTSPTTPAATPAAPTPDDKKTSCALCGGITFNDFAAYQQHMEYTHAGDTMPTSPSQKPLSTTVGSKKEYKSCPYCGALTSSKDVCLSCLKLLKKESAVVTVTDETIQDQPAPVAPLIQNVQPTDDDNLEVPTQMPSSPPSPGQKWVWDAVNGKFVSMPDPEYKTM